MSAASAEQLAQALQAVMDNLDEATLAHEPFLSARKLVREHFEHGAKADKMHAPGIRTE